MLAFALAQGVVCAQPAWAQDNGGGDSAVPMPVPRPTPTPSPSPHDQWFGAAGERWLTRSAARLTAPLRVLLKRTQRA